MWVEGGDIHDELLDQLGAVLTAPSDLPLAPSAAELEALAAAVAGRWPGSATAPVVVSPGGTPDPGRRVRPVRSPRSLRRLGSSAWRAGSVAAGIVVFSASAAAANGGVPLPRPVRVVAYTVGLPVDSPALDDTNQHIEELKEAVEANDKPKAEATARRLQTDLKKVPGHEKKEAVEKVEAVMAISQPLLAPSPTTTTTAPTPPAAGAPDAPSSTTATTVVTSAEAEVGDKPKEKDKEKSSVTTTTAPRSTTTTAPESTTTTTAPETDETPSDGTPAGDPGTGSGDPGTGDPGTGGGDEGSTTPTTTPDGGTTPTTTPDGGGTAGGGDPGATTTTTSSTTTTTMPPADPGRGNQP